MCVCAALCLCSYESSVYPNCLEGSRFLAHFSISFSDTSNRGLITEHLLSRPFKNTTTFPPRWSSTISNSPMYPTSKSIHVPNNTHSLPVKIHVLPDSTYIQSALAHNSPCFIITVRNFTSTLEHGLRRTCRFPLFSALHIALKASFSTLIRTMTTQIYNTRIGTLV